MARILDYIQQKVTNLNDTLKYERTLKSNGFYEITQYIGLNPSIMNGGIIRYADTKNDLNTQRYLDCTYGVSFEFFEFVKTVAQKESKDKSRRFVNLMTSTSGKKEKDLKKDLEKLYNHTNFKGIAKAMTNHINYVVLNSGKPEEGENRLWKIYNNITFNSLPFGQIALYPEIAPTAYDSITTDSLIYLIKKVSPESLEFTNYDINKTIKILRCVVNQEEKYIQITSSNAAKGHISSNDINIDIEKDKQCVPLSVETETDKTSLNTQVVYDDLQKATTYKLLSSPKHPEGCSQQEISHIKSEIKKVQGLVDDKDFIDIEKVSGVNITNSIVAASKLSQILLDSDNGDNAISVKLFFDKQKDIFGLFRANDLFLALYSATYANQKIDEISLHFNKNTGELYCVNENKKQYGFCQTIGRIDMSHSEQVVYAQLYKVNLSVRQKYNLFTKTNILPIVLDEGVVKRTNGLQEAIQRQNLLLSIEDDTIFTDLFIRNIASYVYSYASQEKSENGELKWRIKKNPDWGSGRWFLDGLDWRFSEPNYEYIYSVEETFWTVNSDLSIKEVLAYFVSKGGSKFDNSSYYRKLSQRILGVDYYPFSEKLIPILLDEGHLCIDNLIFSKETQALESVKYEYKYKYATGDVYVKIERLQSISDDIRLLYGEVKASTYIDNQFTILEKAKPQLLSFGDKDKSLNLIISVHNPIFFRKVKGYVGVVGMLTDTLNKGGVSISSNLLDGDFPRYKDVIATDNIRHNQYADYKRNTTGRLNNHLTLFSEWIEYGEGGSSISRGYISEGMIDDGYIFPKGAGLFIPMYIFPELSDKSLKGRPIKTPLEFRSGKRKSDTTFSFSNIFNKKTGKTQLTAKSVENLIKLGWVQKKTKVEDYIEVVKDKKGNDRQIKHLITPITETEAKVIYETILAKYNKLESEIKSEGDRLFSLFCQKQLTPEYRTDIEQLWNSTYNNMAIAEYSKFPVFVEHSRWFGGRKKPFIFGLREAQVEGLKFAVSSDNSGLLAHEVGFGKTTTSIALISHLNLTGEAPRTLIFTPTQVYEKFDDEIRGRDDVLGLLGKDYNVVKLGNGGKKVLMGVYNSKGIQTSPGLKDYEPEELRIINRFKKVIEEAKLSLRNLPYRQARFFTDNSQLSEKAIDSDASVWFGAFYGEVLTILPEIEDRTEAHERLMMIDNLIDDYKKQLYKEEDNLRERKKYKPDDFSTPAKIATFPKYIQDWVKRAQISAKNSVIASGGTIKKGENVLTYYKRDKFPGKHFTTDVDGALEIGILTKAQYDKIKDDLKNKVIDEWEGDYTPSGIKHLISFDENELAGKFFSRKSKGGSVIRVLKVIENLLIDDLGTYKNFVKKTNTIVLCSHQAVKRFRVSQFAINESKKYVANVDDVDYVSNNVERAFDNLAFNPLSLMKLNINGVIVDEIHNFNNLVATPRTHVLANVSDVRGSSSNKSLYLLPTVKSNAIMRKLPDGSAVNPQKGLDEDGSYKIGFNSSGKGSLKVGPTNLMNIVMQVQRNSNVRGLSSKNSIMLSATPFTDNVFQMFSVLGMTNVERMREANLEKVFDFFITFVKEEWRFNITHRNEFGLFAEIQGYYNSAAMANFVKAFSNFKISDRQIEETRPDKYIIPQQVGKETEPGENISSLNFSEHLVGVESFIELSDVQKSMIKTISKFVSGEISTPYAICPNHDKAIKVTAGKAEFLSEEVKEQYKEIESLLKKAKSNDDDREDLLESAYDAIVELIEEYPKDEVLKLERDKIDTLLFGTTEEKKETDFITDFANLGVLALDEEEVFSAKAIVGQSFGQACVISPYLLKCDPSGELENTLLANHPLEGMKEGISVSAKHFVEQSPKIRYAVECAINSIRYNAKDSRSNYEIGGQIIYMDRGKNFKYAGRYYNGYRLIKQYIVDQKYKYFDKDTNTTKAIGENEIEIITGSMTKQIVILDANGKPKKDKDNKTIKMGEREVIRDKFNDGRVKILLGSSAIREGIDLNKRSHTMYILDSDFSPSNAMQLEGRIWRQGNMWKNVRIVYVLGKDSIDAFVYSKLQQKIDEIKKMLESGVYEMNKTQFTIDARERIKRIITDVDQLTELEWQDEQDTLLKTQSEVEQEKTSLDMLRKQYGETYAEFQDYLKAINTLYKVVLSNEKYKLALELKQQLNIKRENEYNFNNANKDIKWRRDNPFMSLTTKQAIQELEKRIENNELEINTPNIVLTNNSDMTQVNVVVEKIRKTIRFNAKSIKAFVNLEPDSQAVILSLPEDEKTFIQKMFSSLYEIKNWVDYNQILSAVSSFAKGTPKENIMSNYDVLIKNRQKLDKNGNKLRKNGDYVMCTSEDIIDLTAEKEVEISQIKNKLASEKTFKERKRKEIILDMEKTEKVSGRTIDQLVGNFEKSMKLLKLR